MQPHLNARVANLPAGRIGRRNVLCMFYVYAIASCVRQYIYVGLTSNVEKRCVQHNNGENKSTKAYKPFKLILKEEFQTRPEARMREKYLKTGIGKEYIRSLVNRPGWRNW